MSIFVLKMSAATAAPRERLRTSLAPTALEHVSSLDIDSSANCIRFSSIICTIGKLLKLLTLIYTKVYLIN